MDKLLKLLQPEPYPKWPATDAARYYIDIRNELRKEILDKLKEMELLP